MSGNAKFRWILLAPLLLAILFTFGCASISYTPVQGNEPWFTEAGRPKVFIHEFDSQTGDVDISNSKTIAKNTVETTMRAAEFLGRIALGWKHVFVPRRAKKEFIPLLKPENYHPEGPERSFCRTSSGINCPQLFKDVFTKEFQALGFQVVENINEAQVIMKGNILLFESMPRPYLGPSGEQVTSGSVDLSLAFVDRNGNLLLQENLDAIKYWPAVKRVEDKETQVNELMHEMFSQFYKDPANLRTVLKEFSNQP